MWYGMGLWLTLKNVEPPPGRCLLVKAAAPHAGVGWTLRSKDGFFDRGLGRLG